MNLDDKIEQCKKDIVALQSFLKQLEDQKEKEKEKKEWVVPKHGDIVVIEQLFKRIVIKDEDGFQAYDVHGNRQAGTGRYCGNSVEMMYNSKPSSRYIVVGNVFDKSLS